MEEKEVIRRNFCYLVDNIGLNDVLDRLFEDGILTESYVEEIKAKVTNRERNRLFLTILCRCGPRAFPSFINALKATGQTHIADKLNSRLSQEGECTQESVTNDEEEEHSEYTPTVKKADMTQFKEDPKAYYKMSSKPRGRAIIVNNTKVRGQSPRHGAKYDSVNLMAFLKQLHFETDLCVDLTAEELKNKLGEESERDHSQYDCFLVFLLSHGTKGYIYASDGERVSIENGIWPLFYSSRCATLENKPKLFFIQACQGEESIKNISTGDEDQYSDCSDSIQQLCQTDNTDSVANVPTDLSDTILAYSTVSGYNSWRNTDLGSFFVRAVIKVFAAHAYKEDLLSLLTKVNIEVNRYCKKYGGNNYLMLPVTKTTLKKKVYFFP